MYMLFSIVVPVYNVERYLNECLQSLVTQDSCILDNSEIILVDDGSTDNSGHICDMYKDKYPRFIRVFHKENEGLLLTRRFGYKQARGEYIINCDSDDRMEKCALEELNYAIQKYHNPDVVLFNYMLYDGKNKQKGTEHIFSSDSISQVKKKEVIKRFLMDNSIVSLAVSICKKNCIDIDKNYKNYSWISNGEDSLQKIEIINNAESFVYINKALYNYRIGTGMTSRFDANYFQSFKVVVEAIKEKSDNWNVSELDNLISIKVLFAAGRAITQTRFYKWKKYKSQKQYLSALGKDELLRHCLQSLPFGLIKKNIQVDYRILLNLLKWHCYSIIIIMLKLKNCTEGTKREI